MNEFEFQRAEDVASAVSAVAEHPGAAFLGGGTNLVDHLKLGIAEPDLLVDVTRLPLDSIEPTDSGGVRIGALARNSDVAADPVIRERYPALAEALLAGASGQLRNLATTAGNLLQRTRCSYFQDASVPCNKREPGSGCPAIGGHERYMAILGASADCIATHPSDMAVAMRVLDAAVETVSPDGAARTVPVADLHRLPGDAPQNDTVLRPGELITHVVLPPAPPGVQTYRKVRDRASYAFALVSVAAVVDASGGTIRSARFAFGGLAHKPWRVEAAEALVAGKPATRDTFDAAADRVLEGARGYGTNDFKIPLARRTLHAVLAETTRA